MHAVGSHTIYVFNCNSHGKVLTSEWHFRKLNAGLVRTTFNIDRGAHDYVMCVSVTRRRDFPCFQTQHTQHSAKSRLSSPKQTREQKTLVLSEQSLEFNEEKIKQHTTRPAFAIGNHLSYTYIITVAYSVMCGL